MSLLLWKMCLNQLKKKLSLTEFSIWIRPLKIKIKKNIIFLYTPNKFSKEWIQNRYIKKIEKIIQKITKKSYSIYIILKTEKEKNKKNIQNKNIPTKKKNKKKYNIYFPKNFEKKSCLNKRYHFDNFIEGKSNTLAKNISYQLANNLKKSCNPLFLYGNTGLGKTHLLHAIGNHILIKKYYAKVAYVHSEFFVQNMVSSLKNNSIEEFKKYYRSLDALLIDDIQFFSNKERSQEELFHTFNTLFESSQKIILTSDRYPKEIKGIADRLKSRFNWGVTVLINPPELKTRIEILKYKATTEKIFLPHSVAYFIAKKIRSNVRELEGAWNTIKTNALFCNCKISIELAEKTLEKLLNPPKQYITIEKIQKKVSNYYKIKISDMISKKRSRSISQPRQIAMTLTKKLTNHSFPEIGKFYGNRDHTTVLYAFQKISKLIEEKKNNIHKDFLNLLKLLHP